MYGRTSTISLIVLFMAIIAGWALWNPVPEKTYHEVVVELDKRIPPDPHPTPAEVVNHFEKKSEPQLRSVVVPRRATLGVTKDHVDYQVVPILPVKIGTKWEVTEDIFVGSYKSLNSYMAAVHDFQRLRVLEKDYLAERLTTGTQVEVIGLGFASGNDSIFYQPFAKVRFGGGDIKESGTWHRDVIIPVSWFDGGYTRLKPVEEKVE